MSERTAMIHHAIRISAPASAIVDAFITLEGLRAWWTSTTDGEPAKGGQLAFHFGAHTVKMEVLEASADGVRWRCLESHPEWVGTEITAAFEADGEQTNVRFTHERWQEQSEFLAHCSMKWATFLLSLRNYVEKGEGKPFPNDIPV